MPAILGKILERGKRLGENGLSYGNEHRVKIGPRVLVLGDFLVYFYWGLVGIGLLLIVLTVAGVKG